MYLCACVSYSLSALKKRLAEAKQKQREEQEEAEEAARAASEGTATQGPRIEEMRILSEGDFERIK